MIIILGFSSCLTTKSVPDGEYLYTGNSYSIKNQKVKSQDVPAYYKQKVNRKIIFLRPYVWLYDIGKVFKDSSKIQNLFCNILGEAPILYDSTLVDASAKNIQQHLRNLGYYDTEIVSVITKNNALKMADVHYNIYPNRGFYLRNVKFDIKNKAVRSFVMANWNKTFLDTGLIFSTNNLKKERKRISNDLRNLGFYYFKKTQISFIADSNFNEHRIDLTLSIKPITIASGDSVKVFVSQQYKIRNIYIYPELADKTPGVKMDTTAIAYSVDNVEKLNYYFIHKGKIRVNPKSIINSIYIKPRRLYREENIAYTYKSLFALNIYNFINVNIIDVNKNIDGVGNLDCIVELSKTDKFSISTESELKNTGGDFGVEQGVGFISRNTFRGGEILSLNLRGALEVQSITNAAESEINKIFKIFNTFEAGINTSLEIPRFLAPVKRNFFSRYFNPKTKIGFGYNYQDRPDYSRYIWTGTFGYNWITNKNVTQILNPIELSSVKIFPTDSFQSTIDNYQDPRIKYSYQDHLVLGMSYSYMYNERKWRSKVPFHFFFSKFELGGIPYNMFSNMFGSTKDSLGQHWISGLPYTQFARVEIDYRYYKPFARGTMMNVFRINIGTGIPLGGSVAVPFEKSFYIGGANSLRAWTLGTLGPGSYSSGSRSFEMTGDIKIEFNYEFRFPISSDIRGAVFTDVGNIFLLKDNDLIPEGVIKFHNFYEKLAMDIGYGIRYDLSFLVIRFDIAHPIYQPYYNKGERWSMRTQGNDSKLIWGLNFAIGYPF